MKFKHTIIETVHAGLGPLKITHERSHVLSQRYELETAGENEA